VAETWAGVVRTAGNSDTISLKALERLWECGQKIASVRSGGWIPEIRKRMRDQGKLVGDFHPGCGSKD